MAIAFRSVSNGIGGVNFTATEPTGAASGDVLLCHIAATASNAITGPSGWTNELDTTWGSGGTAWRYQIWSILRGASAPALGWTAPGLTNVWDMSAYSGAGSIYLDVAAASGNSNSISPTSPSITTVTSNAVLICHYSNLNGTITITVPSGMTSRLNVTGNGQAVADLAEATAGATGTKTWTLGTPPDWSVCSSIALRPAPASVTRDVTSTAATSVAITRDVTSAAATSAAVSRDITSAAATNVAATRDVTTAASVSLQIKFNDVTSAASVSATATRDATSSAAVSATVTRDVTSAASAGLGAQRDVASAASIYKTGSARMGGGSVSAPRSGGATVWGSP